MHKLKPTPFTDQNKKPTVFINQDSNIYQNTARVLENIDLSPAAGKKVMLKPNCGRIARPGSGVVTHPDVVAAAIDAFQKAGATVSIGESPIAGVNTLQAFKAAGIADVAARRNCPLIDMDKRRYISVDIPDGIAVKRLKVCPEVPEHDLIISVPVIKMHMHTGVTMAVKNMKGCLWRRSKVKLHMLPPVKGYAEKSLDIAISDMATVLRPHLSIIDGHYCMEGLGPSAGNVKKLNLALVSADPFAADTVACELIGRHAGDIAHLQLSSRRGFAVTDLRKIKIYPSNWQQFKKKLALPPQNIDVNFPNINILDKNSCSACQSTLLLFLKRYGNELFDYFPNQKKLHIAIGKGHQELPAGTLCIGNCTAAHRHKGIYVKGCPPVSSSILKKISGRESNDVFDGKSTIPDKDK